MARRFATEGLRTAGLGTLLGVLRALALDLVARRQLGAARWADALAVEEGWSFEVQAAVVLVLAAVAVLGSWGPAWAASRVDPLEAIRSE